MKDFAKSFTYGDLELAAQSLLEQLGEAHSGASRAKLEVELRRTKRLLARRRFAEFHDIVGARTFFQRSLLELFCTSRLHRYVMSYMSVQESRDWDTSNTAFPHASLLISQALGRLGKRSLITCGARVGSRWFEIGLDPLVSLRRAYACFLCSKRPLGPVLRSWLGWHMRYCVLLFRIHSTVVRLGSRMALQLWSRPATALHWRRLLGSDATRRQVCLFILILFPTARSLSPPQWNLLLKRITDYFAKNLATLAKLLPSENANGNNSIVKLLKVAFGVVVNRVASRDTHEADEGEFVFNSIRLAYSWGITYPLVDNFLDSDETPQRLRTELVDAIARAFDGQPAPLGVAALDPLVAEVTTRMLEVVALAPPGRSVEVRNTLQLLLTAHQRDAARRLGTVKVPVSMEFQGTVWTDSVLKAALIRMATAELCGMPVDTSLLPSYLSSGLINQFGDDLWDILEDRSEDRVTPFTLFLSKAAERDPFMAFFSHGMQVAMNHGLKRRIAMLIGLQETARCLLDSCSQSAQDDLGVTQALKIALEGIAPDWTPESLRRVPHLDLDAVVFDLANSLLA